MERQSTKEIPLENLSVVDRLKRVEKTGEKETLIHPVPLNKILVDPDVIVDKVHALELADFILKGDFGQTIPFLLRARLVRHSNGKISDEEEYDIADAMHRIVGLKAMLGSDSEYEIMASVMYGCSDKELVRHRVLAVNSIESVKFARTGSWLKTAWSHEEWAEKLSVKEAFQILVAGSSGKKSKLTVKELSDIRIWAEDSCKLLKTSVNNAFKVLRIHEAADPALVAKVRGGHFAKGQLTLTQDQIGIIALNFPHEKNFDIQNYLANFTKKYNVSTIQLQKLVDLCIAQNLRSVNSVKVIAEGFDWKDSNEPTKHTARPFTQPKLARVNSDSQDSQNQEELPILSSLENVINDLGSLGLPSDLRYNIENQLYDAYSLLEQGTRPEYEFAKNFLGMWLFNSLNRAELRHSYEAQVSFMEEVGDFSPDVLKAVCVLGLFASVGKEANSRESISEIISRLPLSKLNSLQCQFIINQASTIFSKLKNGLYDQFGLSTIVDSSLEVLESFVQFKELAPAQWGRMLNELQEVCNSCDRTSQASIQAWIEKNKM